MKKKNKNRKLLFQVAGIVLPLFLLHLVAVVWLSYRNAVNGYLTAQNENIEADLEENYLNLVDNHEPETQKVSEWLLTYLENHADKEWEPLSEEEWLEFDEVTGENKYWSAEWLNSLPEKRGDRRLRDGDVFSVRGFGKGIYDGIAKETKKGRYYVTVRRYV